MKKIISILLTISLVMTVSVSCGSSYDPSELTAAMEELAPKAAELYSVIYGSSIKTSALEESNGYYLVTDERYQTIAELKTAMKEVFSEGYIKVLSNTAFDGVSTDEGSIEAKFKEIDGKLYVNPEVTADFGEMHEFELDSLKVLKQNRFKAKVEISSGDYSQEVILEKEDGVWKLDSALY